MELLSSLIEEVPSPFCRRAKGVSGFPAVLDARKATAKRVLSPRCGKEIVIFLSHGGLAIVLTF